MLPEIKRPKLKGSFISVKVRNFCVGKEPDVSTNATEDITRKSWAKCSLKPLITVLRCCICNISPQKNHKNKYKKIKIKKPMYWLK